VFTNRLGRRFKLNHHRIASPDQMEGECGLSHAAVNEAANGHRLSLRGFPTFSDFTLDFFPGEQFAGDTHLITAYCAKAAPRPEFPEK
jgi:hypothetical protein